MREATSLDVQRTNWNNKLDTQINTSCLSNIYKQNDKDYANYKKKS